MSESDLLRALRPAWLRNITQTLAQETGLSEDLRTQMEAFIDQLERAVETGNMAWLEPILSGWAASLPYTGLEDKSSGLSQLIDKLMLSTFQVCRETLDKSQALDLISALAPAFSFCFEKASFFETQMRVNDVYKQLQQAQHTLEKLDRSKSDFIAVAAHELKTPLTLIEGYTAMLREVRDTQPPASELEISLLNGINSGTRRLKIIIEDMIDVSLIDNQLMQMNFQPVWLNRLLSILKNELEPATRERAQTLELRDFPGSSEMTFGDPERLLQMLRNVLSNAVKFTPDNGRIIVDGRKLPGFVEITVHDSGIGINPEDQGLIFNKFSRLGSSSLHSSGKTKFKGGGPGLGLHIARGIIEAHGGAIWVESPGYDEKTYPGSTFHILLPMLNEPPDARMARLLSPLLHPSSSTEGLS